MSSSKTFILKNETDTRQLAQVLADHNLSGSVWLSGDLGAGKTTLTRYWLQAMGHTGAVKSPTYTLVEPYELVVQGQAKAVYHADLYRLQDPEELSFIGFEDYLADPTALILIEWASRAQTVLPQPQLNIQLIRQSDDTRQVTLTLPASSSPIDFEGLLSKLALAMKPSL